MIRAWACEPKASVHGSAIGRSRKKALAFLRGPFLLVSYRPGRRFFPPNVEGPVPLNVVGPPAVPLVLQFPE